MQAGGQSKLALLIYQLWDLNKWHKLSESSNSHLQDGTEIWTGCMVLGGRRCKADVTSSAPRPHTFRGGAGTGRRCPRPGGVL